ncbi:hypothetical protein [Deferrisoma sp.]
MPLVVEVSSEPSPAGGGVPPEVLAEASGLAVADLVGRHVAPADRDRARSALGPAGRYVQRLSVLTDRVEGGRRVTEVEAVVDRDRVLQVLAGFGIPTARLAVRPRVLATAAPGPAAAPLARALADALEREGVRFRAAPGGGTAEEAIEAARTLGCHVVFLARVEAAVQAMPPLASGPALVPGEGQPEEGWAVASATARGWVVDAVTGDPLGEAEATADGVGADGVEAEARAAARAGQRLAATLLGVLERSGWVLPGKPATVRIRVSGLPAPRALEDLEAALRGLAEVEEVRLAEIAWREGLWEVRARSGGFPWDVVLSWVGSVGGRVRVEAEEGGEIRCAWVDGER